jgi:hypothetical protein
MLEGAQHNGSLEKAHQGSGQNTKTDLQSTTPVRESVLFGMQV